MVRPRGTQVIKITRTETVKLEKNMKEQLVLQGDSENLECRTSIEAPGTTTHHPKHCELKHVGNPYRSNSIVPPAYM